VTISTSKDVYYDPYDVVLNADPEGRIALEELLKRFPEWEVDLTNARLSPTSTVRGWESMPALVP
jgi:hypothetical protein